MVTREALAARAAGVPVQGVCLYPVVNHPGWDDDHHCRNGLWDYPDAAGHREVYEPLAHALRDARIWEVRTREEGVLTAHTALNRWRGRLGRAAEMVAVELSRASQKGRSSEQLP